MKPEPVSFSKFKDLLMLVTICLYSSVSLLVYLVDWPVQIRLVLLYWTPVALVVWMILLLISVDSLYRVYCNFTRKRK